MELKPDTFGDPFALENLPLARPAGGFAIQILGEDRTFDQLSGEFKNIRHSPMNALFESHSAAYQAASDWLTRHNTTPEATPMAIVPACFDPLMERHVLILGVLDPDPDGKTAYPTGTPLALLNPAPITGKDGA